MTLTRAPPRITPVCTTSCRTCFIKSSTLTVWSRALEHGPPTSGYTLKKMTPSLSEDISCQQLFN